MLIEIDVELEVWIQDGGGDQPAAFTQGVNTFRVLRNVRRTYEGRPRYYYTAMDGGKLLMIVTPERPILAYPRGSYAEALVGWDSGYPPYVPQAQAHLRHTKLTLVRPIVALTQLAELPAPFETFKFSQIAARAPIRPREAHGDAEGTGVATADR